MEQLERASERMTPVEAEAVLKRFREEEELRQREMEAAATNPTVADLAEGLGVSKERIAALLAQVRGAGEPVPFRGALTQAEAQEQVQRSNRNAWIIAAVVVVTFFVLMAVGVMFSVASEQPVPAVEEPAAGQTQATSGGGVTPDAEPTR